jgi:uncharacterized membrane protein YjjP (DUF1212 family)
MVTKALLFGLTSMVISYLMGGNRKAALIAMVASIAISVPLSIVVRADPPRR